MANKLNIWNERIFLIQKHFKDSRIIETQGEFFEKIGITTQNKIAEVRKGTQSFTPQQIYDCIKTYKIDPNYIFGLSTQMFQENKKSNPIQKIKESVAELELILNKKVNTKK